MGLKFTNNAFGILSGAITNVATSIVLTGGHGARFPVLVAGDYFYATLVDAAANLEIVKVTARLVDTLTVVRGQDGTAGTAYANGDRLELRLCNAALRALQQEASTLTTAAGTGTYTGTLSPVPTGYNTDQIYLITFTNANAALSPTLNLNGLGPKEIKDSTGAVIGAGRITANSSHFLLYNGTNFVQMGSGGGSVMNVQDALPAGMKQGEQWFESDTGMLAMRYVNPDLTETLVALAQAGGDFVPYAQRGANNGVATLDAGGDVPLTQLGNVPVPTAGQLVPTGTILDFGGDPTAIPTGYLHCNGTAVSRTTYLALWNVIGTFWGAGDGSTTFNLPNLARRVTVGTGGVQDTAVQPLTTVGSLGGESGHVLTVAEIPAHAHGVTDPHHSHTENYMDGGGAIIGMQPTPAGLGNNANSSNLTAGAPTNISIQNTGGGLGHNLMQLSAVVTKMIKT